MGYRGVGSNFTVRKVAEKRLAQLAQFDPVTGLPNRNLLQERLDHAIAQSRRRGRGAGVLFVDLDRFKLVNDSHGHHVGDELLRQVGRSLKDCVRRDDTVARLSGDEFAVVIADLARPDDAAIVAQKIIDSFAVPFDLDGRETFITASIGVAAFPQDGSDAETLLQCADVAMYRAKESSRNAFCFYTAEMNARTASRLQLNTDLRRAVERGEFRLHYQPKVNLATGEMIGMEALLRWQHAERGMVQPLEFIPALEDSGLIVEVGDWVIGEACRQLQEWSRAGLQLAPVAVNLSARQFRRRDIDQVIRRLLAGHGISPELLELEITESSLMEDPKDAIRQLQALREAGLRISVDDFGTGYSSLAYLTRLPLSTLKIDRVFVNAAISESSSAAIVKMVIDMAQRLSFDVVAEGIETEQHVAFLRQHGCGQGQGYHFGRPIPAEAMAPRMRRA
jgi:diguanylate cyclase (GGDEF)-like protein